jgi:hypothetical protein
MFLLENPGGVKGTFRMTAPECSLWARRPRWPFPPRLRWVGSWAAVQVPMVPRSFRF